MLSDRSRPVLIALVAVLAIAVAAGTLNTAVPHDGGVGAGGEDGLGEDMGGDEGREGGDERDPSSFGFTGLAGVFPVIPMPCFPFLNEWRFFAGFALVAGIGLYLLYRRTGPFGPVVAVAALGPPVLLVHAVLTACRAAEEVRISLPLANRTANESVTFGLGGGSGGGGAATGGTPVATVALFGVLGLALIVSVALLFQATGDDEPATPADDSADAVQMAAIGRAAGRAADRIEGETEAENAVYRAWKEMTGLLDVPNPDASTPAEFAAAAVEAGMDRDDVDELTSLFEAVRYGTASPTEARETRAIAAFRRIEDAYADEGQ